MATPEPEEHRRARRAAYDLFARLYLDEPDAALARELRDLPGFAACVPPDEALPAWLDGVAVEHQRLFGQNVYPYESVFVDPELLLNTAATERVVRFYRLGGFDPAGARAGAPDHLGLELRCLGHLVALEDRADGGGDRAGAARARRLQARCLREHLARWAPVCCLAVRRVTAEPLYRELADLTVDLVLGDLATLAPPGGAPDPTAGTAVDRDSAPETPDEPPDGVLRPDVLTGASEADEGPGLNRIVRDLVTPARSGLLLARADLGRVARALGLPLALGDRFQMLRDLFTAAGQYGHLPTLLDALAALVGEADGALAALAAAHPAWAPYGAHWRRRLDGSRALIAALRAQAAGGTPSAGP
ncbi:MAG TPA: molecular chaperone TorD family protein [Thermomicrobiales bacterium]|nr:molecular chaperone TorD family protein [Thermomicrobiales bacterium]